MIDTRLLVYFLSVAREQSFTKAAQALNVTQPTLSKQMMQLEDLLGKQLFIRGKTVTLTEDGEYLRARAQEIVDLMDVTECTIRMQNDMIGGDITIGCGETAIMGFITRIFERLHEQYPDIRFHTFSGDADAVMDRLDKGLVDVALLLGPSRQKKTEYLDLKQHDRFGILMRPDHPLAEREFLTVPDIANLPLAFPQQRSNVTESLEWFGDYASKLNIVATYNLIYNATFLVEQGICLAFCLDGLVPDRGGRDLTFRPLSPEISIPACLTYKKYQTFSPAVRIFLEYIRESLDESQKKD